MARKGILTSSGPDVPQEVAPRPANPAPHGAVGALLSSLSKLQENAIQEIDVSLIDDTGLEDRLGLDPFAQQKLSGSFKTYGLSYYGPTPQSRSDTKLPMAAALPRFTT